MIIYKENDLSDFNNLKQIDKVNILNSFTLYLLLLFGSISEIFAKIFNLVYVTVTLHSFSTYIRKQKLMGYVWLKFFFGSRKATDNAIINIYLCITLSLFEIGNILVTILKKRLFDY